MKLKKIYYWLIGLVIATPLGLLATGSVWGEYGSEEIGEQFGFVPKGLKSLESLWGGLLTDYNLPGFNGFLMESVGYIISAIIGVSVIFLIFKLISLRLPEEPEQHRQGKK